MSFTFSGYCNVLQNIGHSRGVSAKSRLFSELLKKIDTDHELALAVQFTGEGAFDSLSGKRAAAGSRTVGLAAAGFCEIEYDLVFKPCRTATGSSSEAVERLMENLPSAIKKRSPGRYTLTEVAYLFDKIQQAPSRNAKQELLHEAWSGMSGNEIKFFIRIMSQGSLRIGFESKSVVSAISQAWKRDLEQVRYAHMITGSLGKTAVMARKGTLQQARFQLFQPLSFMLASPIDTHFSNPIAEYIAEEKFDGMRAQIHADGKKITLFSRDMNNITSAFPDLASQFASRKMAPLVLDGEICIFKEEKIQPFQMLQKRMGVKKPGKKLLQKHPALFIAYDLLYWKESPLFDLPLVKRRALLEHVAASYSLSISRQFEISSPNHLETAFESALRNGNEGLMLKLKSSRYEYGQRKKSWLKVKKPEGSIVTIIMYAHAGSGRRGGTYSDFTLGVRVKEDERYEEEFIPIGKAYGGYSNEELRKMNQRIRELTVETYGPTLALKPGLVTEIEFDSIQVNKRTKAGYTLRFPRFKSIRWDLSPDDVNTLAHVEELYRSKSEQRDRSDDENPSFLIPNEISFFE